MDAKLKVLILEDVTTDAELIERELRQAKLEAALKRVWNREEFVKALLDFSPDLILSDYTMPQFTAMDALDILRQNNMDMPFILVTGSQTEEVAVECMKAGADDYILKQSLKRLPAAMLNVLKKHEAEKKKAFAEARLRAMMELEQTRDMLTHMIAHDLRNPLSAAMGFIQVMQMKSQPFDPQMKHYLEMANLACHRLLEMINQMLDIMRMEDNKMPVKPIRQNIVPVLQSKIQQFQGTIEANGLRLQLKAPAGPVELTCDAQIIGRVLENLMTNAVKHTSTGGEITIGVEPSAKSGTARLWIQDTGEGIPKEYHHKLFQKYGQVELKKLGRSYDTGLGLVFCRMAVELHGGTIRVDSEVGRGSTFTIDLPAKE